LAIQHLQFYTEIDHQFSDLVGKQNSRELNFFLMRMMNNFILIPIQIPISLLIHQAIECASYQIQEGKIEKAVISVPSYFTNSQRKMISKSVKLCGLRLSKIVDERTALGYVYAVEKLANIKDPRKVAIVDFDAGKLSVCALNFLGKLNQNKIFNQNKCLKLKKLVIFGMIQSAELTLIFSLPIIFQTNSIFLFQPVCLKTLKK
jgi:hypothetical protein